MTFQVLTAPSVTVITVFRGVVQRGVVETGRCFKEAYCIHHQGDESGQASALSALLMFLNLLLRKRLTHSSDDGSIKHL
jgi:hypothetical protein